VDYRVISADSHLEISVERWVHRVPARHRDRAPRRITLPNGGDAWLVENRPLKIVGLELCGKPYEDYEPTGVTYAGSPGTGSPQQRIAEQDQDGVDAEVLFPGIGGSNFWRGIANDESYRAVVRAYNEFLAEEYCAASPDRLIGLGVIPQTSIEDAVEELRYCARAGLRGVCLNSWPAGRTYPSEDDDPFWHEAVALRMPLTVHVALRHLGGANVGQTLRYPKQPPPDLIQVALDPLKRITTWNQGGGLNAAQLLFSGTFLRVPELEIYFAENNLGWIPMFFEQLDMLYDRNVHWANRHFGLPKLDRRPSEYLRQRCHWGFLNNPFGVRIRHEIGVDKVMWASDFPHSDSDWPNSKKVIDKIFEGVPEEEVRPMVRDNAVNFFHLAG
jgi:predicted TIM-barrel fold metal-dependent hydrolase